MHSSAKFAALVLAGVSSAASYAPQPYGAASSSVVAGGNAETSSSAAASSSSAAGAPYADASSTVSSSTGPVFTGPPDLPSFTLAPQAESSSVVSSSTCTEEGGPGPATGYGQGFSVGSVGPTAGYAQATGVVHDTCGNLGKGMICITRAHHAGPTGFPTGGAFPTGAPRYGRIRNGRRGYGNGPAHEQGEFWAVPSGFNRPDCQINYGGTFSSTVDGEGATKIFPVAPSEVDCWSSGGPNTATWAYASSFTPAAPAGVTTTAPPAVGNGYATSSAVAEGASSSSAVVPEGYGSSSAVSSSAAASSSAVGGGYPPMN